MKKVMLLGFAILSLSGISYAACVLGGAFCADDQGVAIGGVLQDGNGSGLPTASSTTIHNAVPRAVGQEIYCNSCTNNSSGNKIELCVSTATTAAGYVFVSSTTKECK